MGEVKANQVTSYEEMKKAGDFQFTSKINLTGIFGMMFLCPCGCGDLGSMNFDNGPDKKGWHWNGNELHPTTKPSILQGKCKWHGYLTDGIFRSV